MLKHTTENFKCRLLKLYNKICSSGNFPHIWKLAELKLIPKSANNPNDPENYRFISLLPTISKLLEKILGNRLSWVLENKLNQSIHGFRRNRSANTLLHTLEYDISTALHNKKHITIISTDIEKAFDKIPAHKILEQMTKWNIGKKFINTIYSFLSHRRIFVNISNSRSKTKNLPNGIPQGSPISVHLFNTFIASLSNSLKLIKGLHHLIYADNVILYAYGENSEINNILQNGLNRLHNWSKLNGVKFPINKIDAIHICRKRDCNLTPLFYNGNEINFVNQISILGLDFRKALNFTPQVNKVVAKMKKANNLLKLICRHKYGPSIKVALQIAKALQLGKIDFLLSIWGFCNKKDTKKSTQN
jgi:hypothetical protein